VSALSESIADQLRLSDAAECGNCCTTGGVRLGAIIEEALDSVELQAIRALVRKWRMGRTLVGELPETAIAWIGL